MPAHSRRAVQVASDGHTEFCTPLLGVVLAVCAVAWYQRRRRARPNGRDVPSGCDGGSKVVGWRRALKQTIAPGTHDAVGKNDDPWPHADAVAVDVPPASDSDSEATPETVCVAPEAVHYDPLPPAAQCRDHFALDVTAAGTHCAVSAVGACLALLGSRRGLPLVVALGDIAALPTVGHDVSGGASLSPKPADACRLHIVTSDVPHAVWIAPERAVVPNGTGDDVALRVCRAVATSVAQAAVHVVRTVDEARAALACSGATEVRAQLCLVVSDWTQLGAPAPTSASDPRIAALVDQFPHLTPTTVRQGVHCIPVLQDADGREVHTFLGAAASSEDAAQNAAAVAYTTRLLRVALPAADTTLGNRLAAAFTRAFDVEAAVACVVQFDGEEGVFAMRRASLASNSRDAGTAAVLLPWSMHVEVVWPTDQGLAACDPTWQAHTLRFTMDGLDDTLARDAVLEQLAWGRGVTMRRAGRAAAATVHVFVESPTGARVEAATTLQEDDVGEAGAPLRVRLEGGGVVAVQFYPGCM